MYHTSAPNGQAHLRNGQNIDDCCRSAPAGLNGLVFPINFRASVQGRIRPMEYCSYRPLLKGRENFLKSCNYEARLIGERQCSGYALNDKVIHAFCKVRGGFGLNFKAFCKGVCRNRLFDETPVAADPDAAARQAPVEIGDDNAVRRQSEADQIFRVKRPPRDGAQPLGSRNGA